MGTIYDKPVKEIMEKSFLDYSMSVITDRALPDVRDGLKPVHRRILYAMYESGNVAGKPYRKSARTVGDVIGKFHPHGDSSVYTAMVRMAQPFSLLAPLIDGQGNFGSLDGDPPAAMRYTEARLSRFATDLFFSELDQETVDWRPNYDGSEKEPVVLPVAVPHLLVNGIEGIAVGMASSIPTHNLREVIEATKYLMRHPEVSSAQLIELMPGPDFPTGGILVDLSGYAEAIETGRGRVKVRAKWHEEKRPRGTAIVLDELPYGVNKATLIETIANLVKERKIEDISDLRDESSKEGVRVWIALKQGADAQLVMAQLFSLTPLESTYTYNCTVLESGVRPRVMGLRQCLLAWIDFRREVVRKRFVFERTKAQQRLHVLDGLIVAVSRIDEVVATIRQSADAESAKRALMPLLGIDEVQAKAILDLRLHRLTNLEIEALKEEHAELLARIAEIDAILASSERIDAIIIEELDQAALSFGEDRRTLIDTSQGGIEREDLIRDEEVIVVLTRRGYVKRVSSDSLRRQNRGTRGKRMVELADDDVLVLMQKARSKDLLMLFTASGRAHAIKAYQLPERERHVKNCIEGLDEEVVASCIVHEGEHADLLFATRGGLVKRAPVDLYTGAWRKGGIAAITLDDGDALVDVHLVRDEDSVTLITSGGDAIRFPANQIRPSGRTAKGVIGMRCGNDQVVAMLVLSPQAQGDMLIVSEKGFGKRIAPELFRDQNRGGKGVRAFSVMPRTGKVISACWVTPQNDVLILASNGVSNRIDVDEIRLLGKNASGSSLIRLDEGASVAFVTTVAKEQSETEASSEEQSPASPARSTNVPSTDSLF